MCNLVWKEKDVDLSQKSIPDHKLFNFIKLFIVPDVRISFSICLVWKWKNSHFICENLEKSSHSTPLSDGWYESNVPTYKW